MFLLIEAYPITRFMLKVEYIGFRITRPQVSSNSFKLTEFKAKFKFFGILVNSVRYTCIKLVGIAKPDFKISEAVYDSHCVSFSYDSR